MEGRSSSRRAREMQLQVVSGQMQQHQEQQQWQQQHRRGYSMSSSARREKVDEDLALFQDMRKREHTHYLHPDPNDAAAAAAAAKLAGFLDPPVAPTAAHQRKGVGADLLNSDADKNDYDWLLTPPGTPLFPSLDLDSPAYSALQQGLLINRSLAAIKTSRIASNNRADPPPSSKLVRGNPSPSRRPSTPLNGHSNSAVLQGMSQNTTHSVRPSTPTRSSSNSAAKYNPGRPSTPTRQSSSSITPTGGRLPSTTTNSNRPSTPTNRPSTPTAAGRPLTPTLRRSSSSSTSTQPFSTTATRGNPSPTRSTASSVPARGMSPVRSQYRGSSPARGISPVRSQYRGSSPSRGTSPAPSMGRASSSPRAHPIIIPDGLPSDIPPNLRTTSDRPSSAHRRRTGYGVDGTGGQMPDGLDHHHPSRRPSSPNLIRCCSSTGHGQDRLSAQSGRVSSDDDSSYEVSSHSAVSSRGLTPEHRGGYRQQQTSAGNEDWRNSCPSLQSKRSPSPHRDSSHFGPPSTSRRVPDSSAASRNLEIQRASAAAVAVGGFRPLMTKNSISAFYSNRANSLLRSRPLTPGSTASSEQGASVAPDSEGDEDLSNGWGRLELSLGGRAADILVLDTEAAKLTSWEESLQCDGELKLLESRIHSEIHEADSYEALGRIEALVEESSPYLRESSKTRSIHDEAKHNECTGGAATESFYLEEELAQKVTNLELHEQGREQPGQKQQNRQNLQSKEDNALVLEFWGNSESELRNGSNSERKQIRPLLIKGESCGHGQEDDEVGVRKVRETPANLEKDVGRSVPDLKHVKEKLVLLQCGPNVVPALQQSPEQHNLVDEGPGRVVKQATSPSFVELPVHDPYVISQGRRSDDKSLATKEVGTGSSMEEAAEKMCVHSDHADRPGMYCNLGSECSKVHVSSVPTLEVQSSTNDVYGGSEAVKLRPMCRQEVQNGVLVDMGRQKNIWYVYRNSEDYGSPSMSGTETELEDHSPRGLSPGMIEKQVQLAAASCHNMSPTTTDITQTLELFDQPCVVDEATLSHECQSDHSVKLLNTGGLMKEIPGECQREQLLLSWKQEMPGESEKRVYQEEEEEEEEEESVELACYSQSKSLQMKKPCVELHDSFVAQLPDENKKTVVTPEPNEFNRDRCTDFRQLDDSLSDCGSRLCVQEEELAPGSGTIRCSDSKADNLSSLFSSQECGSPKMERSTLTGNLKMKEGNLQGVATRIGMEDIVKQGDGNSSSSLSQEVEHGIDPGKEEALLQPVMVKAPSEGLGEPAERRMIEETGDDSKVETTLNSRWDGIESPAVHCCQDLKQRPDHDPPVILASTPEGVDHANHVSDVTESGKNAEYDQADAHSDHKGWEQKRENEAALPETKMGEACRLTGEVQDTECRPVVCSNQGVLEIPESNGSCANLKHPISLDASIWSAVAGTRDQADAQMPVEDHKQALYLDASIAQMPLKMISPVESEERVSGSGGAAVPVREAIGESVSKLDEVEEVKHVHGQALKKPMGLLGSHHVNGNALKLAAKPVGKVDKNSPPAGDKFEKPVGVGAKVSSDHGKIKLLKEAISCDAEEENKLSHPYGENKSGIWNPKLSPTKARVSDVSDLPSLPMELLHKQGASIRQAGDVTKSSSPGFHQPTFVKYGSMRSASQAVGAQSLIKQISLEERGGLDHFADTLEEPKASTVPQMTEDNNLSTLKNSETKKAAAGAILIKTVSKSNNHARKSSKTLASKETAVVEVSRLVGLPTVDTVNHVDGSVQLPDGKKLTLSDLALSSPVKEEVVENSESLGPIARKHLSSFKFGRKKPSAAAAEPERKGNIVNMNAEVSKDHHNMKQQVASLSSTKLPGKSQALGGAKAVVVGAAATPNGPQLSKLNSVRAGSPMRAVQSGDSQPAQFAQGSNNTNGRIAEELNGQSRFSNITVRPGSVSQHFEWDRSSLEEVSSSSSSSKSTDAATVVSRNITLANTTERILFCSSIVHKLMYEATELSGEKERHSFSISPDLKLFANAGILTKPEKHRPGGGSSKQKGGHEQKGESAKGAYGTTILRHICTYLPSEEGFEKPGRKQRMQIPKAQVMHHSSTGEEGQVTVKENVSMHPTETVRLNFELNSNVNKVNDKCCCVIL